MSEPGDDRLLVPNAVLAEAITSRKERARLELPQEVDEPSWMIVELDLRHAEALGRATKAFLEINLDRNAVITNGDARAGGLVEE